MADFPSLGLSDWLVRQCQQMGINKPTDVQVNCVPAILQGELSSRETLVYSSGCPDCVPLSDNNLTPPLVATLPGRDCMGCAKTGSGKTAAFVLPVLQKLSEEPYGIFCLVLTPTRCVLGLQL